MSKPWSEIRTTLSPDQQSEIETKAKEVIAEIQEHRSRPFSLGDYSPHDLLGTLVIAVEQTLDELTYLKAQNAVLMERMTALEISMKRRELQPA